jgi:hypothetical protein
VLEVANAGLPSADRVAPAPAADQDAPLSATFEFHRTVPATGDGFYVLGLVTNSSAVPIAKPKVVIVFVDAAGVEVGTASGFAIDDQLAPGKSSYLSAIISDPPPHRELRFEVVPRRITLGPKQAAGLVVVAGEPRSDGSLIRRFWGTVKNAGADPASFVRVDVISFDVSDKLLGVHFNYAEGEVVPPGESVRFEVSAVIQGSPVRFEYHATGMVR